MSSMKQVVAVRTDLGMGKGKLAAQVAHASLGAAEEAMSRREEWYERWKSEGQLKVVVKVSGEGQLLELLKQAKKEHLPATLIQDRGLTQVEPGSTTCVGIGPAPSDQVDRITGKLKLL
jgi:PTH2 family peptidyl-tRNA hydrolase